MRFAAFFALMLVGLSDAALAAPGFPSEIMTFDGLAEEFRLPMSMKLRDMRKVFRVREVRPGEVEFLNDSDQRLVSVSLIRVLSADGTSRTEETTLRSPKGHMLFKESVQTEGTDLKLGVASKKIFLEGRSEYGLVVNNEKRKVVRISADDKELFRFVSSRAEDGKSVVTDVYFADAKVLVIRDMRNESDTLRVLDFDRIAGSFSLRAFGFWVEREYGSLVALRAVSEQNAGYVLDAHRFSLNGTELYGLDGYLQKFNETVYTPLILNSGSKALQILITNYLPATQPKSSVGRPNRFLDELVNLRAQVEQAKTTPSLLSTVSTTLSSFINSITEGSLVISDQRPKE